MKRVKPEDRISYKYLEEHPFEIKLNSQQYSSLVPSFEEMIEIIKVQDPTFWEQIKESNE